MNLNILTKKISIVFMVALFMLGGVRNSLAEFTSIDPPKANHIDAKIKMLNGEMKISAGEKAVLVGSFNERKVIYTHQLTYTEKDDTGYLDVIQDNFPSIGEYPPVDTFDQWDLRLVRDKSLLLRVELDQAKGVLDLRHLNLKRIDLDSASGHALIDLTGEYKDNVYGTIQNARGHVTLILAENKGVRIDAHLFEGDLDLKGFKQESGVYVNDHYDPLKNNVVLRLGRGQGVIQLVVKE